jgi:hypothetical protein
MTVSGRHCDCSPRASENLAKPLPGKVSRVQADLAINRKIYSPTNNRNPRVHPAPKVLIIEFLGFYSTMIILFFAKQIYI